jgi:retron-type reverse transcriptase|nr:reverse transcriptase family protein [Kofleriaceae bacterium]
MADRRQEIYDRIRASSKDTVVLEEMIRLGFWPARGVVPNDPAEEIHERAELERQMAALRTEQSRLHNIEALKKALRKQRLDASKAKQKETKLRRERERIARAAAWAQAKTQDIVWLGRGVSGGLNERASDAAKLARWKLPKLDTPADIATALGITIPSLRFLAYNRATSPVTHYRRWAIAKKTGGMRRISAPMPRLKAAQHWLLEHVLDKVTLADAAHGFRSERSIVTNAKPHVGAGVVINLDLKDFFPTLTYRRIKGMFRGLGYGDAAATIFALLCSEPEVDEVELDGLRWYVATGARTLPQGAPTSPAVTNIVCRRLDARLAGAARALGFAYTRYADDLTFSGAAGADVGAMLDRVRFVTAAEGFAEHPAKTRVLRRGRRQEVTGVVVNSKLGVERETLRKFRALLFQIGKDGPTGKQWGATDDVFAGALGFANYVRMVDAAKGVKLVAQVKALAAKHGWKPPPRGGGGGGGKPKPPAPSKPVAPTTAAPTEPTPTAPEPAAPDAPAEPKKKKWWQIF